MSIKNIIVSQKAKPLGNYPHLKVVGDFIYISGTSSRKNDDTHRGASLQADGTWLLDIEEQTRGVIENIKEYLHIIDCDLSNIIDINTFLVNMKDFKGYNKVYTEYFNAESGPTRTTVAVSELPHPNLLIEIKAIAYKKS
jgi:2-aminomuconate deaminase